MMHEGTDARGKWQMADAIEVWDNLQDWTAVLTDVTTFVLLEQSAANFGTAQSVGSSGASSGSTRSLHVFQRGPVLRRVDVGDKALTIDTRSCSLVVPVSKRTEASVLAPARTQ